MKIVTRTRKLSKILNNQRKTKEYFRKDRTKKIEARLDEFINANNLSDIPYTPPTRCHQLSPYKLCQFAVDINKNYRIIFEGYDKNGYLSPNKRLITIIQILSIEDYH